MKLIRRGAIPASYCDADVKLSVVGAFQMVEDLVTDMMEELGIDGLTCMHTYGGMWVFVRNRIEMLTDLHWKEEYLAECYISSIGRARLTEDTVLKHADGRPAMVSRLELCAVDLNDRKLRKMDTVGISDSITAEEPEMDIRYRRGRFETGRLLEEVIVRSTDIDYCHHTNNISYVRYLMNQWNVEELSCRPVRAIEVQYAGQTHEGDAMQVWKCCDSDKESGEERFAILHDGKAVVNMCVTR